MNLSNKNPKTDWIAALPKTAQALLRLAADNTDNIDGEVLMSSALAALAFSDATEAREDPTLDEVDKRARVETALKAIKLSKDVKKDMLILRNLDKAENGGLIEINLTSELVEVSDEEKKERLTALGIEK